MTQDFLRRIIGYNKGWFNAFNWAAIPTAASITINCPAGPGRIEAIVIYMDDIVLTRWVLNNLRITLDGTNYWNAALDTFMADYLINYMTSPLDGSTVGGARSDAKLDCKLDYETSAVVVLTNSVSPNNTGMSLNAYCRNGR